MFPLSIDYYETRGLTSGNKAVASSLVNMISTECRPPARILDAMSGNGLVARLLAEVGYSVTPVEYSSCVTSFSRVDPLIVEDPAHTGIAQPLELVFAFGMLEHLSNEQVVPVLEEWRRLADRAIVVVESAVRRDSQYTSVHPDDWWEERFAAAGWTIEDPANAISRAVLPWSVFVLSDMRIMREVCV